MASTLSPPSNGTLPRRLSHTDLKAEALEQGTEPVVVVPPQLHDVEQSSEASEIASAIEMARRHLDGLTSAQIAPNLPEKTRITGEYAFAFDIDGVLIKGGKPIPQAVDAMKMLNGQNNHGIKV